MQQIRGVVPFFEEYDAMVEAEYNQDEWKKVSYVEKAEAVAYHRLKRLIGLHENDAVQRHYERQQRKMRKRR